MQGILIHITKVVVDALSKKCLSFSTKIPYRQLDVSKNISD